MTTEEESSATSIPSAASTEITQGHEDEGHAIVDRSSDPNAEEKALKLKEEGNQYLMAGKFIEAIKCYSDALEFQPNSAILRSNRAQAFIKVENYGLALQDADYAIEHDPEYAKGYYRRGSANYALEHFKKARKDFRQVCKLRPKDRDARAKFNECDKRVREEAFAKAIEAEATAPLSATYDPNIIEVPSSYEGPHPLETLISDHDMEAGMFEPGKLPRDFVMATIQCMKEQKLIHKRYVARVLLSCRTYFCNLSSLMEISIPTNPPSHQPDAKPRLTVCGDTHGQYYDVLNIFDMNGFPDRQNPYLFNGDFVDRGSFSLEVILTFLMFKLMDPECIYLTRGNHETKVSRNRET